MSSEVRQVWWSRPLGNVLWLFITFVCFTLRKRVRGNVERLRETQSIVALWHNNIFVPCYFYRYVIRGKVGMSMLTSASKDGTMLSTVANNYGMRTVRGSGHRRGVVGFIDMLRELKGGMSMCIKLASMSGLPITPLRFHYGACLRMRTWDRFHVPLPFSRVELEICEQISVPKGLTDEELNSYCAELEKSLGGD